MTQAQAIAITSAPVAHKARPTLTLVESDIYNPDPAMVYEALWRFNEALPNTFGNKDAENIVIKSALHVLWLVENPYNPDSKTQPAKRAFYTMLARFEAEHGKGNLPERVFKRARWLGLVGKEQSSAPKEPKDVAASAEKRAKAESNRRDRAEKNRAAAMAKKGVSSGGRSQNNTGGKKKGKK